MEEYFCHVFAYSIKWGWNSYHNSNDDDDDDDGDNEDDDGGGAHWHANVQLKNSRSVGRRRVAVNYTASPGLMCADL